MGTGCGIQTFHLLAHADHVTATDISPRALAFARFNLLLNAPALKLDPQNLEARVSLRQGSLLEPVAGEQFDLVVSNPPFVITPRRANESSDDQFTYRDGGLPGDDIVSTLIRRIPEVLVPGGRAQMLGNWEIHRNNTGEAQPWDARLRTWFAESVTGTPSEAWVIQREVLDPRNPMRKPGSKTRAKTATATTTRKPTEPISTTLKTGTFILLGSGCSGSAARRTPPKPHP